MVEQVGSVVFGCELYTTRAQYSCQEVFGSCESAGIWRFSLRIRQRTFLGFQRCNVALRP